jgi:alpha-L-fucosidase
MSHHLSSRPTPLRHTAVVLLLLSSPLFGPQKLTLESAIAQDPSEVDAAKLARPTPGQVAWHDLELGMFIHWGIETFLDVETDTEPSMDYLKRVNPKNLNTDRWVAVAESMGAKYIIIVAKHHGGFCLWPTDTTPYNVSNTPWRDGQGDVLRDLVDSCRRRGMRLGVYVSPADFHFGAIMGGGGKTAEPEQQQQYIQVYRQQLKEVLTAYGPMMEVWFDGSLGVIDVGDILKEHARDAAVFQSKYATMRWVGNEQAVAPYPAWNSLPAEEAMTGVATAEHGDPTGDAWLPNECDGRMRATWFWNSFGADTLKSVDDLMDRYYRSVGHGAVMLLNVAPDVTGAIPAADVKRAAEFGAEIRRRFDSPVASRTGQGQILELEFQRPTMIDHAVSMEVISSGERVLEYAIEGQVEGRWEELGNGTAIGHKKIDAFNPVSVERVRLHVKRAQAEPKFRRFSVYYTQKTTAAPQEIVCEGTYGGHLQGVATDGKSIYWSHTVQLVKTDMEGILQNRVDVPNHHGDLTVVDGRVYVAVELGKFNQPAGQSDSWVYIYDAADFSLLARHPVPELVHGAGGIASHDGKFIVVGGLPADLQENYVFEYDREFRFQARHVLPSGQTELGIQTAGYVDGHWCFGCYGSPANPGLLVADEAFKLVGQSDADYSYGIEQLEIDTVLRGECLDDYRRGKVQFDHGVLGTIQWVVGRWEIDAEDGRSTILRIDLTPYIDDAGQYDVCFRATSRPANVKINLVKLFVEKEELDPKFARAIDGASTCKLNISATPTGHLESHVIEVELQLDKAGATGVMAVIGKLRHERRN